jgi:very-short-patch-repair endonuclease
VERELAMARVCRRQDGAVGIEQLFGLGYSAHELKHLVGGGAFVRRHRGVLLDARVPATPRGQLFAALLAFGTGAFLSHRTAAALHGLRAVNVRAIEVTVVSGHTPKHPRLIAHRTSATPHQDEVRTRDGLSFSSVSRLLMELASRETRAELDRLIAEAARRRSLDLERIGQMIARHPRHPGIAELRAALAAYQPSPDDKSALEKAFAAWLATLPDIPTPVRTVELAGRWEIDFYWPTYSLAVELDGRPYHSLPADQERDRIKDVWLQRNAISIVRVTEFRFEHDRAGIEADLRHFLADDRAA